MSIKSVFPHKIAGISLIISLLLLLAFHLLVALKIIPGDIVWGGTLDADAVVRYELVSAFVTVLCLLIAAMKIRGTKNKTVTTLVTVFVWFMGVFFAVMTVGNATAKTVTEKVIFIPLSLLMSIASFRLAIEKKD